MGYTQRELNAIRRRDESRARMLGTISQRIGRSGRETMRISREAYFNAIDINGGVRPDGTTVWDDDEFVRDMQRKYPHTVVHADGSRVSLGEGGRAPAMRNRFGRVKERIIFRADGSKEIIRGKS